MDPTLKILAERLGIPAEPEAVLKAVALRLDAGQAAMTNLSAILAALGIEDVPGATAKIAQMFKSCAELEKAMPELGALREQKAAADDKTAEAEVDTAMQAHRVPPIAKAAMLLYRKTDAAKFHAEYPVAPGSRAYLTQPVFAGGESAGTQLGAPRGALPVLPPPPPGSNAPVDLSRYAGRNITEQALAHLDATDPNAKRMSMLDRFSAARRIVASLAA